jgi:hypothetical protein
MAGPPGVAHERQVLVRRYHDSRLDLVLHPGWHAIQDEWIVPPLSVTASSRFRGVNIRIYNPEQQSWQIAWIDGRGRKFSLFTAVSDSARITMTGVDARGRPARNIFSEITPVSFSWTKEWTFDQGRTWIPVSRIRCTRKN